MRIDVLTLFPEMFSAVTENSITGRAADSGLLDIRTVNIRDFSCDKHRKADDSPYGGGVGMVMTADPIFRALEATGTQDAKLLYMSPRGDILNYSKIRELSGHSRLVVLCGHYEGVDERVLEHWNMEEVSIGDYILTGGELAAMVMIDAVSRMIPGVLGDHQSASEESVYSGLLEYPQYTKPRDYRGMPVPDVLVSGNHEAIRLWQFEQSLILTKKNRPDLLVRYAEENGTLSKKEKAILEKVMEMT